VCRLCGLQLLANLGVNKLVLPAVPEAYDTWKGRVWVRQRAAGRAAGPAAAGHHAVPGGGDPGEALHPKRRSKALMRLMPFMAQAAQDQGYTQGAMAQAADAALELGPEPGKVWGPSRPRPCESLTPWRGSSP